MVSVGITVALSIFVVWWLLRPHLDLCSEVASEEKRRGGGAAKQASLMELDRGAALQDQRTRCLQLLKDLELDFQMKKIDEGDYHQMRRPLVAELGAIIERERSREGAPRS